MSDNGDISYDEREDGSLVIWLSRGDEAHGFAKGHAFTSIAAGRIAPEGYLDIADAKRVIDNLTAALSRAEQAERQRDCPHYQTSMGVCDSFAHRRAAQAKITRLSDPERLIELAERLEHLKFYDRLALLQSYFDEKEGESTKEGWEKR